MGCTYDKNMKLGEHLNINYDFLWYPSVFTLQFLIYKLRHSTLGINKAILKLWKLKCRAILSNLIGNRFCNKFMIWTWNSNSSRRNNTHKKRMIIVDEFPVREVDWAHFLADFGVFCDEISLKMDFNNLGSFIIDDYKDPIPLLYQKIFIQTIIFCV